MALVENFEDVECVFSVHEIEKRNQRDPVCSFYR